MKSAWVIMLVVFSVCLDLATTELALTVNPQKLVERNPVYYMLGRTIFWSLYLGFTIMVLALLVHIDIETKRNPLRKYIITRKVAWIVIGGYGLFRLISVVNNLWQIIA